MFKCLKFGKLYIDFYVESIYVYAKATNMKTVLTTTLALGLSITLNAQTGIDCSSAQPLTTTSNFCTPATQITSDTCYWMSFVATSEHVKIELETVKYGIDAPHIFGLNLFEGTCGSLNLIGADQLPRYDEAKILTLDLNLPSLVIGNTYYLRADRKPADFVCTMPICSANGSTNPATFDICIQDIDVIIPTDFDNEPPVTSLAMETNRGQLLSTDGTPVDDVILFSQNIHPNIFIKEKNVSYVIKGNDNGVPSSQRIDMNYDEASPRYDVYKTEVVAGVTNYYLPHIPDGVTSNRSYSRVVSNGVWENIDVQYYSNISGHKNYFIVRETGDFNDIILQFDGLNSISIHNDNLELNADLGTVLFEKPTAYLVDASGNIITGVPTINASYQLVGTDKVKFDIPSYPTSSPTTLVIQIDQGNQSGSPKNIENLRWSTYYGSTENDNIEDIDNDLFGNVYFTGGTTGLDFPSSNQTIFPTSFDATRMIVGSHEPLGKRRWTTIYGAQQDYGYGVATDNLNNVYVTGVTGVFSEPNQFLDFAQTGSYNFAPLNGITSAVYATIFKFDQFTGAREWVTLFGEHDNDAYFFGRTVATDDNGNVYIAGDGQRETSAHPILASGSQHLETTTGQRVGFIAGFNVSNDLVWSTMWGNPDIRINEMNCVNNELYIVGTATNTNTAMYSTAIEELNDYQEPFAGGATDAFFAKFSSSNELLWSSFYGGSGNDQGYGIDYYTPTASLYLSGQTSSNSSSFPIQNLFSPQPLVHFNSAVNGIDGFISVLRNIPETTGGHTLFYSSYFGGDGEDRSGKLDISTLGNAYVVGRTKSQTNFPLNEMVNGYYQDVLENDPTGIHFDSHILGIDVNMELQWSSFYGGEWYFQGSNTSAQSDDNGNGITVFSDDLIYIGGTTTADVGFPTTVDLTLSPNAYIQYENSGDPFDIPDGWRDGFLAEFSTEGTILSLEEHGPEGVFGDLTVYPNPNSGSFVITSSNLNNTGKLNIEIFNIVGQAVYHEAIQVNSTTLNKEVILGNCVTGVYVVKLYSGNNSVSRRIVIK